MGSTRDARRAGIRQATSDTAAMTSAVRKSGEVNRGHAEEDALHRPSGDPHPHHTKENARHEKPQA